MLLPLSWLDEYVDVRGIPEAELVRKLFSCGFEVEEVLRPWEEVSGCVVGRLDEVFKHPNADTLQICKVDCGTHGVVQVITGATNIAQGDVVPVALHGATLMNGVKIKTGKLRGEQSQGMLCSGEELGIDDDWYDGAGVDGIMILAPGDAPGTDVKALLGLDERVLDISVTANRPDCQCILGMAREVAAAFALPLRAPELGYETLSEDSGFKVSVLDPDLCPRYVGHYVRDVKITRSPPVIRRRLKLCGINAINSVVDVTNYIMLELGQPMHAFDARDVAGNEIIVRRAKQGEKITTLDEREFTLSTDNLLICDGEKPVALAGIMGGQNSEIKDDTPSVIFEAAKFDKANVRRSVRALGQSSDAAKRFEKGVDDYTTGLAMQRALHLMDKHGFGKVTTTHADVWAQPNQTNEPITATIAGINAVLGIEVPATDIVDILRRLNFEVTLSGDTLTATAPPYRDDVEGCPDLAEEVIRVYGFEHIKPTLMSSASLTPGGHTPQQKLEQRLGAAVLAQGFFESIHFSFYSPRDLDMLELPPDAPERDAVVISNPIAEHYSIMRRTLVPSLLRTIARNCKRGVPSGRLFELAGSYIPTPGQELPKQGQLLCLAAFGADESYLALKGALEQISATLGLPLAYEKGATPYLHPGVSAKITLDGSAVGCIGQLAYTVQDTFEIAKPVFVAELDMAALSAHCAGLSRFEPLPAHLEVQRDLALVAGESVTNAQIETAIRAACPRVSAVRLFDIYRSEQIGTDKKSMAYSLTFTPTDAALNAETVDGYVQKILAALEPLGAQIRT